jgi:hypothetical protein
MSEEHFAVSKVAPTPAAQADYDAICAALMHTARGRWFLEEYARRNRSADTRLLLTAIERIEAVVCAERNKQAQQGLRTDLLEMAQAITRTRAEVAEVGAEAASPQGSAAPPDDAAAPRPRPPQARDVFAAAERIRDVTWAMRGHGFDPATCDQLEELAASILSASALRDPSDHRASKLSEVLQYLERRIDTLLESCTDDDAAAAEPASEADRPEAKLVNGFANRLVAAPITEPGELEAADFEADPASPPPAPPIDLGGAAPDARIEDEEVEVEVVDVEAEAIELDVVAVEEAAPGDPPGPETAPTPPRSDAPEGQPAAPISAHNHEAAGCAEPPRATRAPLAAAPLQALEPIDSSQLLPKSPPLRTTSPAARSFLPEIDMPASGPYPAWADRVPPAAAPPPPAPAASAAPSPPPPAQPTAAALQAPQADPLAGLKAMSETELIALFS